MSGDNIRVWPVEGDKIGDPVEYPPFTKYRYEPHFGGATGDKNHDMVLYKTDSSGTEHELGRHPMGEILVAFSGQPDPFKRPGNVAAPAPAKSAKSSK